MLRAMKRIIALALSGSFVLMTGCASLVEKVVQEPKVTFAGVDVRDFKQEGGTVLVRLQVENPNSFALKIDDLKYELEVGGKHLSTGQLAEPASVKGNGKTIVPIPIPIKFNDLFASAMDFIQKRTTKYRVKGEARFGLINVPFDQKGDLKLKQ